MAKRVALAALTLALWTTVAYAFLLGLSHLYIEPVRSIFSPDPEFRQHGKPVLSLAGAILWFQVVTLQGIGAAWLSGRVFGLTRPTKYFLFSLLTIVSSLYVTIWHPTLLLVLLDESQWEAYSAIAGRLPALKAIYYNFGLPRLKYHVLAGQIVLTTSVCFLVIAVSRLRKRRASG